MTRPTPRPILVLFILALALPATLVATATTAQAQLVRPHVECGQHPSQPVSVNCTAYVCFDQYDQRCVLR